MKLNWIASTTLSLIRIVESSSMATDDFSGSVHSKRAVLKSDAAIKTFRTESDRILERLVSASLEPTVFWSHLADEVVSLDGVEPLKPQACEVALLRAGQSQLQSEQTAAAIFRSLDTCGRVLKTDLPRLSEQLSLRYAPLKQAFEAYGPGMLRSIGDQIWNGSAPSDWWPSKVTVHAVQPLQSGAAGHSTHQPSVWIEAVLTDISPDVPEWLRLVYRLTHLAIDTHTRTHAGSSASDALGKPTQSTTELPWSLAIIPLILDLATERDLLGKGSLGNGSMPISQAIQLWLPNEAMGLPTESEADEAILTRNVLGQEGTAERQEVIAERIEQWWREVGANTKAFPIALKDLAVRLECRHTTSHSGDI